MFVIKAEVSDPVPLRALSSATNKIVGISDDAAAFLRGFF